MKPLSRGSIALAFAALAILLGSIVAFAASSVTSDGQIGTGSRDTSACDTDGFEITGVSPQSTPTVPLGSTPGFNLAQVKFSGLNNACNGKAYHLWVGANTGTCVVDQDGVMSVVSASAVVNLHTDVACGSTTLNQFQLVIYE